MKIKKIGPENNYINFEKVNSLTIDDLHFKLIYRLFQVGSVYVIDKGSYEGHKRLEFDHVTFRIQYPGTRPLAPQMPPGVPPVTTDKDIEEYFVNYLMDPELKKNEIYKYASYIVPQLDKIIWMLKQGNTNQATISVGDKDSVNQSDPACLRILDFKRKNNLINLIVYHRSWDLLCGLPQNIGGYQLLKEYVCEATGLKDGCIIGSSKGLHLYDYQWPIALARLNGQMPENSIISKKEAELGEGWMADKENPNSDVMEMFDSKAITGF